MDYESFYRIDEGDVIGQKYKPGSVFHYKIGIPNVDEECAIMIEHDRYNGAQAKAMAQLYEEKIAPPCVEIGIEPGKLIFESGDNRNMRPNDYDLFDSEYGDFIVYELIPTLTEKYNLKISPNPDWHLVGGGSSGGLSSWVIAWFHPSYFHRIYMSSPSFLPMGRGEELPALIRKYETKPFKVYEEYSEHEPNDYFGWTYIGGLSGKKSIEFAGYDFTVKYFEGGGHCSHRYDDDEAYIRMKTIWEGYLEHPIVAPRNSRRVDMVVPYGTYWEKTESFPKSEPIHEIFSSDFNMQYCGDVNLEEIWKYPVDLNRNVIKQKYIHTYLHTLPGIYPKGALDMDLDAYDHLYVLTMMGIQCVRPFGIVDVILNLPEGETPEMISIQGKELYLKTDKGIWKRPLVVEGRTEEKTEPHFMWYHTD